MIKDKEVDEWSEKVKWERLTAEDKKFLIEEANLSHKESINSCESLDTKALVILVICVLSILVISILTLGDIENYGFPVSLLLIPLALSLGSAFWALMTTEYISQGNSPMNHLQEGCSDLILESSIVSKQYYIRVNENLNSMKGGKINFAMIMLYISISIFPLACLYY
ncbi:hypothetical protein LCGC14_1776120 [marine sediment metagenome]|uniref:Uncharacterized protein n=1 Tax=marine sediment metagenome TaxID=412755 RepID=A0A0F9GWU3_9ZZZZ|nr:hypothetical protein [Candidatus Scalindua sp.]